MRERVYMFIQGLEEARIIEGYRKFPSNKLVIIRNKRINEFNMKIEEKVAKLVEKIKKKLEPAVSEIEEVKVDFFDFIDCFVGIGEAIRREVEKGREVYVNITGGTKLVSSAALLAASLYGAHPFYVSAKSYSRIEVIGKEAGEVYEIPPIPLSLPSETEVGILRAIEELGGVADSIEQVAEVVMEKGLFKRSRRGRPRKREGKDKQRELATLCASLSYHIRQMNHKGYVRARFIGRRMRVELTSLGRLIARASRVFLGAKEPRKGY